MLLQQSDSVLRLFKLYGKMAGVVVHAEMFRQSWVISMLCPEAIK